MQHYLSEEERIKTNQIIEKEIKELENLYKNKCIQENINFNDNTNEVVKLMKEDIEEYRQQLLLNMELTFNC